MDTFQTVVIVLVWTFAVILVYSIANTMIFGYVDPTMQDMAYSSRDNITGGFVNYENYVDRTNMIKAGFNIACFILLLIPYAYLFVRLLLKKEQTVQPVPYYAPQGGGW